MKVNLKEFRDFLPIRSLVNGPLCILVCRLISPLISIPCIKYRVSPNTITLMMIISGLVSGLLFSQTSLVCKIVASLLYFLWFILDCSDGEVARFTKTFSNYGKQLDWVAHLICHPLLYIAIWIYFYNKGIIDMGFLSVVTMCFMSIEIIGRNLISYDFFLFKDNRLNGNKKKFNVLQYINIQIFYFPNFVLFFPPLLIIDEIIGIGYILYVYMIWGSLLSLYSLKEFLRYIIYFYKH